MRFPVFRMSFCGRGHVLAEGQLEVGVFESEPIELEVLHPSAVFGIAA